MSKQKLINQLAGLLDDRPLWTVFRYDLSTGLYKHKGKLLTRDECLKVQTKCAVFFRKNIVKTDRN